MEEQPKRKRKGRANNSRIATEVGQACDRFFQKRGMWFGGFRDTMASDYRARIARMNEEDSDDDDSE